MFLLVGKTSSWDKNGLCFQKTFSALPALFLGLNWMMLLQSLGVALQFFPQLTSKVPFYSLLAVCVRFYSGKTLPEEKPDACWKMRIFTWAIILSQLAMILSDALSRKKQLLPFVTQSFILPVNCGLPCSAIITVWIKRVEIILINVECLLRGLTPMSLLVLVTGVW